MHNSISNIARFSHDAMTGHRATHSLCVRHAAAFRGRRLAQGWQHSAGLRAIAIKPKAYCIRSQQSGIHNGGYMRSGIGFGPDNASPNREFGPCATTSGSHTCLGQLVRTSTYICIAQFSTARLVVAPLSHTPCTQAVHHSRYTLAIARHHHTITYKT